MKEPPDIPPIHITENGCAYGVAPDADEWRADPGADRLSESSHPGRGRRWRAQGSTSRAISAGRRWTTFEWAEGYTQRLAPAQYRRTHLARTPRTSFDWYADFIRMHLPARAEPGLFEDTPARQPTIARMARIGSQRRF